jgi:hypothetical protein
MKILIPVDGSEFSRQVFGPENRFPRSWNVPVMLVREGMAGVGSHR